MASPFQTATDDRYWGAEIQRRERDEDRRVAEFKMNRDMASIRRPVALASAGSVSYLHDLMLDKALSTGVTEADAEQRIGDWFATPRPQRVVSDAIDRLKGEGFTGRARQEAASAGSRNDVPSADEVPAGCYAVATEDGAVNELAFYKVDRPTEGRWAGYVFVKLVVGGHEDQRLSWATSKAVLAKIAAVGAKEASIAYGREIGVCGICGIHLTNDVSREYGIGPECRKKYGW